jgi:hypothetical protein
MPVANGLPLAREGGIFGVLPLSAKQIPLRRSFPINGGEDANRVEQFLFQVGWRA